MTVLHGKDPIRYTISGLCRLFGVSKQAYYKSLYKVREPYKPMVAEITEFCRAERSVDPRIGCRKLWLVYRGEHGSASRRTFEEILAANGLLLRITRRRIRTTDSAHGLPLYPNLVYSVIPVRPCQIWVADITYIRLHNADGSTRFCYLSTVMDAYSRYIMGYYVGRTLETVHSLVALNLALKTSHRLGLSLTGLIHHSDRGVQYASEDYVKVLNENHILISMTETGNPRDNPQAERINSTIKNELLHGLVFGSISDVMRELPPKIEYYNTRRPHMSLDNMPPAQALCRIGEIPKKWMSYRDLAIEAQTPALKTL